MFQKEGYARHVQHRAFQAVKDQPRASCSACSHTGNMDGVLDRKFLKKGTVSSSPDQPDLTDSHAGPPFRASRTPEGFFPDA